MFRDVVFFEGQERLPADVMLSLDEIRAWAARSGLVWDRDAQLLGRDRLAEVGKVLTPEDQLGVAVAISDKHGELEYNEYPYLPVRSLIKRGAAVTIVYWRLIPAELSSDGRASTFGEVRFGFWLQQCSDEFCSLTTAAQVVPKFVDQLGELEGEFSVTNESQGGARNYCGRCSSRKFHKAGSIL